MQCCAALDSAAASQFILTCRTIYGVHVNRRTLAFSLATFTLGGCALQSPLPPPSAGNPASPDAAEAPVSVPSGTLSASHDSGSMAAMAEPEMQGMDGMKARTHGSDMPGMSHDDSAPGKLPATTPTNRNHSATTQGAYVCPMHAQVTSNQPGKCPICGMKLAKKDGKQ